MELSSLLTDLFLRHRDRTAMETAGRTWTYAALDRLTRSVAAYIDRRCAAGRRVLIVGEHSAEAVVWALAAMRSSALYTPMNPELPAERMAESVLAARPGLVVCFDRETVVKLEGTGVAVVYAGDVGRPDDAPDHEPRGSAVAYSIFTSGSTGAPKLVNVGHSGLLNLCRSLRRRLDIAPGERLVQFASLSFDASVSELLGALYAGATLVVPVRTKGSWLGSVSHHIAAHGCDLIMLAPSVYGRLEDAARRRIRKIEFSGEALSEVEFARAIAHSRVFNAYGPTEATVCFSIAELTSFSTTIGRPIDGFEARIHDPGTDTYPASGEGELVILGDGVALGYEGGREDDRPVFRTVEGVRAYHTGDRVALADGELTYLGRIDEQIKRLGHRIDLAHLEARLSARLDRRVALLQLGDELVLADTAGDGTAGSLMSALRETLPAWEVPDRIVCVPALPLSTSGKLDRNALRSRLAEESGDTAPGGAEAARAAQQAVMDVVTAVLGHGIEPEASLFDAGGSSLAMMRIQVRLTELYGEEQVEAAFDAMDYDFTVAGFLRHLRGEQPVRAASAAESVAQRVGEELDRLRSELPVLHGRLRTPGAQEGAVLVTGVSGFVGGYVLDRLLAGPRPVLVVTTGEGGRVLEAHRARFGRGTADYGPVRTLTYAELEKAVEGGVQDGPVVDAVVHCGYEVNHLLPLERHMASSVRNTVLLVRAAAAYGARSFAFLSAGSSGETFVPFGAEALSAIADPYSQSKFVCETYVDTLRDLGCEVDHYRIGLIYGHRDNERAFLANDWFTELLQISQKLGTMPRLGGYIPVCGVQELARTVLSGVEGGGHGRTVVVHRTYELPELLGLLGLGTSDVLEVADWLELVRTSPDTDPRVVAALQGALGGQGWRTPSHEVERDILADLVGLLPKTAPAGV
ncbi:AMP-binding protein [Streptomyces sp. NPDC002536]